MTKNVVAAVVVVSSSSSCSTHGDILYISGLRWCKLSTRTVIITEMVHMIITAAKYTPTTSTSVIDQQRDVDDKLDSTQGVQTSDKEFVLFRSAKLW